MSGFASIRASRLVALFVAALAGVPGGAKQAHGQPAPGRYGCLSFHEVHATVTPQEALRMAVPRGFKIYPQLRDRDDRLLLRESPILRGSDIAEAHAIFDPETSRSIVTIRLSSSAAGRFEAFAKTNIGRQLAIALDDQVISSVLIREPIPKGSMQIESNFTSIAEAQYLVSFLTRRTCPDE